jgi:hypothetical protein
MIYEGVPIKSASIENIVSQRDAVLERLARAYDLIAEAEGIAARAHLGFPEFSLDQYSRSCSDIISGYNRAGRPEIVAGTKKKIDREAWKYLLGESGMKSFMDAKAREQFSRNLDSGQFPEFTAENISATFSQLYDTRAEMFERGVLECFRLLSRKYATNDLFKFGKRIIVKSFFSGYGSLNGRMATAVDDLLRVFHVLDGKPEPDHRHGLHGINLRSGTDSVYDDSYISLKGFLNGNAHITFKRPDLVEKMNRILVRHFPEALPAPR